MGGIKSRRLRCTGYGIRRDKSNQPWKKVLKVVPKGRRPMRRPKSNWWNLVGQNMRRVKIKEVGGCLRALWKQWVAEESNGHGSK